jgi:cell division protein FtsN
MTRDYAKRSSSQKKPSYLVLWLSVLALFVIFTLGLVYFGKHRRQIQPLSKVAQKAVAASSHQKKPNMVVTKKVVLPKFDFYTILPQKSDRASVSEYMLEVAMLKDYAAADHLKAKLVLLGFTVNISSVRINSVKKYQVSVGPYDNKEGANADLERLKQNRIRGKLKKIR